MNIETLLIKDAVDGEGTVPDRVRFAIDLKTGDPVAPSRLPAHVGIVRFDPEWLQEAHRLFMRLINIRIRDPKLEWRDLVAFFRAADYVPSGLASWPIERIEPVVIRWRVYRNVARNIALARVPADWLRIRDEYEVELAKRALRMPPEKVERGEMYDPLDMMWIAHTYGMLEGKKGPRYVQCATPGCERFVPAPWPPPTGRPPRFCDPSCDALGRDLAGHKKRKSHYDQECRDVLSRALHSLPSREKKFQNDQGRRELARRLYKKIRKQLERVPGVRGERWVAKQLKREEFNGR